MLDHWKTLLGTMGVPPASAASALDKIETAVLHSVPAIWNTFSTAVHDEGGAAQSKTDLDQQVEDYFCD